MKRRSPIPATFVLSVLVLFPGYAAGSMKPASANLGWGYSQDLGPHGTSLTPIPSLSATWRIASHLAVRSNVAYLHERTIPDIAVHQSDFAPLAAGLRFYAGQDRERTRGFFLDAAPAIFLARLENPSGGSLYKASLGFEAGGGVRFAGLDGSRLEVGLNYYHSAPVGFSPGLGPLGAGGRLEGSSSIHPGLGLFAVYLAIGFGD